MKNLIIVLFYSFTLALQSHAQALKLSYEKIPEGYILYALNPEFYPVSLALNLDISNFRFSEGEKKIFVIPAKAEKFKIGELVLISPTTKSKFSYKYNTAVGDVTITAYDKSFLYDLPFQKGKSYNVFQSYNGKFSHKNENAIDFTMPVGSEILAAREGLVVKVVQNNTESCPTQDCEKYNNHITILHPDGTFANYAHIKFNGAKYSVGDKVNRGDVIAYSGNVGYSSGPHLHFVCYRGSFGKWETIETNFKIGKGDESAFLKEKVTYYRDY